MKVLTKGTTLTIRFEGFEKVWTLKNKVDIRAECITSLKWYKDYQHFRRLIRLAGTGLPAKLSAGAFRGHDERVFLYLKGSRGWRRKAEDVLVVKSPGCEFDEIAISLGRRQAQAALTWWNSISRPKSPSA